MSYLLHYHVAIAILALGIVKADQWVKADRGEKLDRISRFFKAALIMTSTGIVCSAGFLASCLWSNQPSSYASIAAFWLALVCFMNFQRLKKRTEESPATL